MKNAAERSSVEHDVESSCSFEDVTSFHPFSNLQAL